MHMISVYPKGSSISHPQHLIRPLGWGRFQMKSACLLRSLQPPPSSKQTGAFDLALVSATALGLALS